MVVSEVSVVWILAMGCGAMFRVSNELSSLETTDEIVSSFSFSSLWLSLVTMFDIVSLRWFCTAVISWSGRSLRGKLTSQPASLKGHSTTSSGHCSLCCSISLRLTFSPHLLGHSKITSGHHFVWSPTIKECFPSLLQRLQLTIRSKHFYWQCCLRYFLSSPTISQLLVHVGLPLWKIDFQNTPFLHS